MIDNLLSWFSCSFASLFDFSTKLKNQTAKLIFNVYPAFLERFFRLAASNMRPQVQKPINYKPRLSQPIPTSSNTTDEL